MGERRPCFYVVSSLEGGGAEYQIPAIVAALEAAGQRVRVFACHWGDGMAADRLDRAGVPWELLAPPGAGRGASLRRLWALAQAERPGLIWTSLPRATLDGQLVGRALGVPVVSWQHSAYTRPYKRLAMPLLQRLSDLWVADSADVAAYLADTMRVGPDRILRWPLFVAPAAAPRAAAWTGGDFVIGSVGRLHAHKNYPLLLRGVAALRDRVPSRPVRLRIAGAGPDEAMLRALAAELGLADRLELVGHLDDPSAFLAGLHLYAQPSRMEGMCIAAHEAMAAGLAVVATPVGELRRSVVDGRTGQQLADERPDTLAAALARFVRDPALAHACGEQARALVRHRFSAAAFAAAPIAVLDRLAALHCPRRPVGRPALRPQEG